MSRTKQMIAIDLGTHVARAVWVQLRGDTPVITRAETFSLPMDEEDPNKLIRAWIDKIGLAKQFCAIALPGSQTVFQSGRIMANDPRTPAQIAAMDIAQFSEMAGDEMSYDVFAYEPKLEQGVRRYVMAMARPTVINDFVQNASTLHFRTSDLIAAPVALYNALERFAGAHDEPWCYAAIGHTQTEIAVGFANGLAFARSIAVGGKLFTDAVVQTTGLPPVQAEVRKHADCGLRETDACCDALRSAADRWISQYNACMGVYRSQFQDRRLAIGRLVLTGGGAQMKGLKEYLIAKLGMPVILASELPAMSAEHRPYAGVYDTVFGLAVTAMKSCTTYLSLLPEDLKDEVVFKAKKPWWIAAAVFLLVSMGLYSATGMYTLRRDGAQLDQERQLLNKREQIDKRIHFLKAMGSQILTNSTPLATLLMNGPLAREVLTLVASSVNRDDWITLFCDEKSYTRKEQGEQPKPNGLQPVARSPFSLFRIGAPRPATSAIAQPSAPESKKDAKKALPETLSTLFIVEGYTPNPSLKSVRELIERLKTSPEIVRVDLRSDDQVLTPTGIDDPETEKLLHYRRFVIEIEVRRS